MFSSACDKTDVPPSADSALISKNCSDPLSHSVKILKLNKVKNDLLRHNEFARQAFNRKRKVIIRNTPVVTYAEVKSFMGRFAVADISISKRQQHAIVTLKNGWEAESAVEELHGTKLASWDVQISLYRADNLLYVTGLPVDIIKDDNEFHSFVQVHGPVEKCFLMRSSDGQSKGYGLVEFAHNREKSEHARCKLDGLRLSSNSLAIRCQFVDESIASFEELHSQCLYVSNLPHDITEDELKMWFSSLAQPSQCQITQLDDKSHRFALVEFVAGIEAEYVVCEMKDRQCAMSLEYCGPGETPADVCLSIRSKISRPLSVNTVEVCPAVVNMLENNPQIVDYFQRLLYQLHKNVCQQTVQGSHGVHTCQSDTLLLMNPSFQIALLAVILAGQQQKQQVLPYVGEPMMSQAAAMMEKHYPSSTFNLYDTRVSHLPGASLLSTIPLPMLSTPSFNAGPLPPISVMLPPITCTPEGDKVSISSSKTAVVSQYTIPSYNAPGLSVQPATSAQSTISKRSTTSLVHVDSMVPADSVASLSAVLPHNSYSEMDTVKFPISLPPFGADPYVISNTPCGTRLPHNPVVPSFPMHSMISHFLPPSKGLAINSFPPNGPLLPPLPSSSLQVNSFPALGLLPPQKSHPLPSSSSQVNTFPQLSSLLPVNLQPLPSSSLQVNTFPQLSSLLPVNLQPLPSSSLQVNSFPPLGPLPPQNSEPLQSSSLQVNSFPPLSSLLPINLHPLPSSSLQVNSLPPLGSLPLAKSHPLPSALLPVSAIPSHSMTHQQCSHPLLNTDSLVPAQGKIPPLSSCQPSSDVSAVNWAPGNSAFVPPSASCASSSHNKDMSLDATDLKSVSCSGTQYNLCSDLPSSDVIPPANKRKVLRAIVGRATRDGELKANQENNARLATSSNTVCELPMINRTLTESNSNIGQSVISVIGQKRAHRAISNDSEVQLPVSPVGVKPNFIPSPEPSPDGGYVGQHSQGIGGHYADSYFTKRRRIIE